MALLGNYSVILKNPVTFIGGTQVSNCRSAFNQMGQNRQRYYPETSGGLPTTTALPEGYLTPNAWMIPYDLGSMTTNNLNGVGDFDATGVAGLSGTVSMAGSGLLEATGGLLAGLEVTMSGTGNLTALGGGLLQAIVAMAGTGALSAVIAAEAGLTVTMAGVGTLTVAPQGTGEMELIIYVNQSEATVQQIASGVWDAVANNYDTAGTMGEKMNDAGSASNPWSDTSTYGAGTKGKLLQDAADAAELASIK